MGEFARRTWRTATREIPSTRAISRLLTPFVCSSRIVVRCAWLNMCFRLREKSFVDALELFGNASDLLVCRFAWLSIQFHGRCARQSSIDAVHSLPAATRAPSRRTLGAFPSLRA